MFGMATIRSNVVSFGLHRVLAKVYRFCLNLVYNKIEIHRHDSEFSAEFWELKVVNKPSVGLWCMTFIVIWPWRKKVLRYTCEKGEPFQAQEAWSDTHTRVKRRHMLKIERKEQGYGSSKKKRNSGRREIQANSTIASENEKFKHPLPRRRILFYFIVFKYIGAVAITSNVINEHTLRSMDRKELLTL